MIFTTPFAIALASVLTTAAESTPTDSAATAPAAAQQNGVTPEPAPEQPAAPAAASSPAKTTDEAFATRVKTLEEKVVDMKERIYRSKSRLLLLQETVLGGDLSSGARAVIVHRNEMGNSFILESVAYALDGTAVFTKVDNLGDLASREEIEIFNGRIVPGNHQVAVKMVYRGHGYGVFSYLDGYKFRLQSNQTFSAEPGKVSTLRIVGYEKGGITTDVKDKPAIRFDLSALAEKAPAADSIGSTPGSSNSSVPAGAPATTP